MTENPKKMWLGAGLLCGIALIRLLPELPGKSRVSQERDELWEGVALGVGFGWGVIAAMNAVIGISQHFFQKKKREEVHNAAPQTQAKGAGA